jgi:solute carrier family 13 (sodium-dependent dicarboxylate transporter), member 2/3/5
VKVLSGDFFCFCLYCSFDKKPPLNTTVFLRLLSFFAGPLLFAAISLLVPETFIGPNANKTLGIAAWMITWWVTEAIPISVTALLPLVAFPFLGVMKMNEAAAPYANHIIFLFMGGFLLAIALEKHRLHERIALALINVTGTSGNGIIMGFMFATGILSMWISNTATAMMMLPIANSVIDLLRTDKRQAISALPRNERNFALSLMLMVGYAATLGGLATLIGTPPNVVFAGLLDEYFNERISFGKWMLVGVPVAFTLLFSTYFILTKLLFPNRLAKVEGTDVLVRTRLAALGPVTNTEKKVMAVFLLTSVLWIFQEVLNNYLFHRDVLNDTNVAMTGGILMFLVPVNLKKMEFILDWKDTEHMQWGILILFGGGLCLAAGLENTGLIQELGNWIASRSTFSVSLILLLIVITVLLSEFMSNVALVQIFIPVVFGIAKGLDVNPILLAMPVTLAASIGFMFPIATPPNAIVFSSGYIRMKDMVRAGFVLDIASILIILLSTVTIVIAVFG